MHKILEELCTLINKNNMDPNNEWLSSILDDLSAGHKSGITETGQDDSRQEDAQVEATHPGSCALM